MAGISIRKLAKSYVGRADAAAVADLDLDIEPGQFVTLLGPSGCGKTTTLRLIAGYIRPDAGSIHIGGRLVSSPAGVVPPEGRGMGMVFQNYAVWPHKTVFENVAFGPRLRRLARPQIRAQVERMLDLVNLSGLEGRYPAELSGGQQQRVALARSLVVEPEILLLDEPLSNLDAKLRERLRVELKLVQRRTGITFIYVTHDQTEALALSDRIAVMHGGRMQQYGTPQEIYGRPVNRIVADFMGLVNLVPGEVLSASAGRGQVAVAGGLPLDLPLPPGCAAGQAVELGIRPEDISLGAPDGAGPGGTILDRVFLGNLTEYQVGLGPDLVLRVQTHPRQAFAPGEAVGLRFDPQNLSVFPPPALSAAAGVGREGEQA